MFGTLKNTRQMNTSGIGLGLFICKQIVEQFNGLIMVESELRQGTSFYFYFDLGEEDECSDDEMKLSEKVNLSTVQSQN